MTSNKNSSRIRLHSVKSITLRRPPSSELVLMLFPFRSVVFQSLSSKSQVTLNQTQNFQYWTKSVPKTLQFKDNLRTNHYYAKSQGKHAKLREIQLHLIEYPQFLTLGKNLAALEITNPIWSW